MTGIQSGREWGLGGGQGRAGHVLHVLILTVELWDL